MTHLNLFDQLAAHPSLVLAVTIWIVLVLHLPYHVEQRRDRHGHTRSIYRSMIYQYEHGPNYERLEYYIIHWLQKAILQLGTDSWAVQRNNVLRCVINVIQRLLGV